MIVSNLNKSLNATQLFKDVNFVLNDGDKIGLVGVNGSGKSTLLKILAGNLQQDSGKINYNGESVALLKQEINHTDYDLSVIDYIKKDTNIYSIEKKLHELENNLNESNMEEYGNVLEQFLSIDGYNFENNLTYTLSGLNFNSDINKKIKELSGGEKIKVLLSAVLLSNPDILLLDEPTNNLDIEAIEWLEGYLKKIDKKMIIVSHDEVFLDNVVNKIFELENGNILEFNLPYSEYLSYKDLLYNQSLEEYEILQEKRKALKSAINESREWASTGLSKKSSDNDKLSANFAKERTKKVQSRTSKLSKELEKLDVDTGFRKKEKIKFIIDYSDGKGNKDIYLDDVICGYDEFSTCKIRLDIPFGTRVNIIGPNGSGKTTLLKTIIGKLKAKQGKVVVGNEVKFGYISQDSLDGDSNLSVYNYLTKDNEVDNSLLFNVLNQFNIKYEDKDKLFSYLSPGERTRVNLAKLSLNKTNVLILDEATNHLDLEAIKVLEEVLDTFNGTIISVSHNRKFNELLNSEINLDIKSGIIYNNHSISK